jgi:uncharacterized membrane protein YphA (DoxX/SURF4 family)
VSADRRPAAGKDRPPARPYPTPGQRHASVGEPVASAGVTDRVTGFAAGWGPAVSRVLLGLVLAWFGYHELVQPSVWTGYVPILSPTSGLATILVLSHGWVLLLLAVALVAGIAPRLAAAVAAILVAEIVISLTASGGLSDLTLRDVGVLGLAICLTGIRQDRLILTR